MREIDDLPQLCRGIALLQAGGAKQDVSCHGSRSKPHVPMRRPFECLPATNPDPSIAVKQHATLQTDRAAKRPIETEGDVTVVYCCQLSCCLRCNYVARKYYQDAKLVSVYMAEHFTCNLRHHLGRRKRSIPFSVPQRLALGLVYKQPMEA